MSYCRWYSKELENVTENEQEKCYEQAGRECLRCTYYGKAADAPDTTQKDCMWQPCEEDGYDVLCEKGEEK